MAIKIAGLSQKEALEQLQISRSTLFRFRKDPHWPGDDAPLNVLKSWVAVKSGQAGRKPSPQAPQRPKPGPTGDIDESYDEQIRQQKELDWELKRSQIEKNHAAIAKHIKLHMSEHRRELIGQIGRAFDRFFDDLEHCNLETEQLANIRESLKRCRIEIDDGQQHEIQPVLLEVDHNE